jgi:formylglycine-generating enzyme required for sulfatase activity
MPFQPQAHQELTVDGVLLRYAEHPNARGIPYAQEGNSAVVYRLETHEDRRALKVFHSRFRTLHLVSPPDQIASLASLPGLQVCQRTILTPSRHAELLRSFPDLIYAILMPWVEGPTWQTVLLSRNDPSWSPFTPGQSLSIAHALARVLLSMEERGIAHCDLSASNLIFTPDLSQATAALVDVEGIYAPRLSRPELPPAGSPGYAHQTASQGVWSVKADRFAGAVLLAEILGWSSNQVRRAAWGESYFQAEELQRDNERYQTLIANLRATWGDAVAGLLARAWQSKTLAECPTLGEWLVALPDKAPPFTIEVGETERNPSRAAGVEISPLILQAEQAATEGRLDAALALYRHVTRIAPPKLAADLRNRIRTLDGQQRAVPGWTWLLGRVVAFAFVMGLTGFGLGWWPPTAEPTLTPTPTSTAALAVAPTASPTAIATSTATQAAPPTATLTPTPTATPTPIFALGDNWMRPGDRMEMVYVPAGGFEMGSSDGGSDEPPVHRILLDSFWIDRTEVTNAQYRRCAKAGVCDAPTACDWGGSTYEDAERMDYPAFCVDWYSAQAYCEWAGGRLPTEAEWEYAARGPAANIYPWGNAFHGQLLDFCDATCEYNHRNPAFDDGYARAAPVASYPDGASWCGALDMAGNVWEWVSDWYGYGYYRVSATQNPTGPSSGNSRVLRGGSWYDNERNVRSANRFFYNPLYRYYRVGFRCVAAGPEGSTGPGSSVDAPPPALDRVTE